MSLFICKFSYLLIVLSAETKSLFGSTGSSTPFGSSSFGQNNSGNTSGFGTSTFGQSSGFGTTAFGSQNTTGGGFGTNQSQQSGFGSFGNTAANTG